MPDGHRITYKGSWDEAPNTNTGDLSFILRTHKHHLFTRERNNLRMKIEISLLESLVGFKREVEHLDGHVFEIATERVTIPGLLLLLSLLLFL